MRPDRRLGAVVCGGVGQRQDGRAAAPATSRIIQTPPDQVGVPLRRSRRSGGCMSWETPPARGDASACGERGLRTGRGGGGSRGAAGAPVRVRTEQSGGGGAVFARCRGGGARGV